MSVPIVGIDEVGRGAWAGPLVLAAVCVPPMWQDGAVRDSKRYQGSDSSKMRQRVRACRIVQEEALFVLVREYSPAEVDRVGVHQANIQLSLELAQAAVQTLPCVAIVMDGDPPKDRGAFPPATRWVQKADSLYPAVSAASCVAKVHRDQYMVALAQRFPYWNFAGSKGYYCVRHKQGLDEYGVTEHHRRSFKPVKKIAGTVGIWQPR